MNSTGTNKDRKRLVLNDFLWKPYECSYECSSFASVCVCAGVFVSKANALFFVKKRCRENGASITFWRSPPGSTIRWVVEGMFTEWM